MAVGMIITCTICGKTYDEGKESHWDCDGGAALREEEQALNDFKSMSVDDRLEFLYWQNTRLKKRLQNMNFPRMY